MKNVYLFQPENFQEVKGTKHYWLPYAVGCLWAYANQFEDIKSNFTLKKLFFHTEAVEQVLNQIENPAVCGFSSYMWNEAYNLVLAKEIKQRWPNCVILFGGPESGADYLAYDFIDSICMAEGETRFVSALRNVLTGTEVPVFFPKERVQDLAELPSPYTSGVFDNIIDENPDIQWQTVLETNRGCPYACTFCDWGGTTYSKVKKFDLEKIYAELEWFNRSNVKTFFIADANFGIFKERDLEIARAIKRICKDVEYVNITYTKNSNENVFEIFNELYPLTKSITFSMQSMNPPTLEAIKRANLKSNDLTHLMSLARQYNISTYTEMILGLPLETVESWRKGICDLIEAGQSWVDVYFALLIRNSELATPTSRMQYGIKSVKVTNYTFYEHIVKGVPPQLAEIVSATNTMNHEEMTEAFMYSWMVGAIHFMGYSHYIASYCKHVFSTSYKEFYDRMYTMISDNRYGLRDDFIKVQLNAYNILTTGSLLDEHRMQDINHFAFVKYVDLYSKKQEIVDFAFCVAREFGAIPNDIKHLQNMSIIDVDRLEPFFINTEHDISTWEKVPTQYKIVPRNKTFNATQFDIIHERRRGSLKNQIIKQEE